MGHVVFNTVSKFAHFLGFSHFIHMKNGPEFAEKPDVPTAEAFTNDSDPGPVSWTFSVRIKSKFPDFVFLSRIRIQIITYKVYMDP